MRNNVPHNVRPPHDQLHGALTRANQGGITILHIVILHGRAFEQKVSPIMYRMQSGTAGKTPIYSAGLKGEA